MTRVKEGVGTVIDHAENTFPTREPESVSRAQGGDTIRGTLHLDERRAVPAVETEMTGRP